MRSRAEEVGAGNEIMAEKTRKRAVLSLNGTLVEASGEELFLSLAEFLRHRRARPGTKIVCAEGDCGACSVLKATPDRRGWLPINSCILSVGQCDSEHFVTIEGIRDGEKMHPVQSAMLACHASQCGYCTPGFVTTLCGLVDGGRGDVDATKVRNALTGNLCRCTGYQPIIDAGVRAAQECSGAAAPNLAKRYLGARAVAAVKKATATLLVGEFSGRTFYAPRSLRELLVLRRKFPKSTLLGAGTDLGVAVNKGKIEPAVFLSLHRLRDWRTLRVKGKRLQVGAGVTLTDLRDFLRGLESRKKWQLREIICYLDIFASPQIKNAATLIGNIANASPIGDMPPLLLTLDAELEIAAGPKRRRVALNAFFRGYRQTALRPGEVITGVSFDLPARGEILSYRKVTQRRDLDISCVNGGFRALRDRRGNWVKVRFAMGGVGPIPLRLKKSESAFARVPAVDKVVAALQAEITPIGDLRGSAAYRRVLAEKMMRTFAEKCAAEERA